MRHFIPYLICGSLFWVSCIFGHKKEEKVLPPLEITPEQLFSYVGKNISEINQECQNREGYYTARPSWPGSITLIRLKAVDTRTPGIRYNLFITVEDSNRQVSRVRVLCQDTLQLPDANKQILYYYNHGFKSMTDLIEQQAWSTFRNTLIPLNEWLQKLQGLNCQAPILRFRNKNLDVLAICRPVSEGADRYTYEFSIWRYKY